MKSSFTDVTRYEYGPTKHDAIYGFDPDRWLASGYMGHLPCFPFYGPPSSEDEVRAVLGNHGQAPIVEWAKTGAEVRDDGVTLRYGATLDKTQYRVQRAVTHPKRQRCGVDGWVENMASYDRPLNCVQHATFGLPFVEPGKTMLDASAIRGLVGGGKPDAISLRPGMEVTWPEGIGVDGNRVSLRAMQPVPHAGS